VIFMPFDGIVTKAVKEEIQKEIVPGKITKIYQPTATELVFTVRSKGKNHSLLLSIHPTYARFHLTNDIYQNPAQPPMFCMLLRKHLLGSIIESIEQFGMERIVSFNITARNEIGDTTYKTLVMELMGKHSNVIFLDKEKEHIIDSLKRVSMSQNRYRTILPGSTYKLPPTQEKVNPLEISGNEFLKGIDFNAGRIDSQIVHLLTGISPFIAKEFVARTQLGSPKVYLEKFMEFQEQIRSQTTEPRIYRNKKEDFHVLPITSFQGKSEHFDSTNAMLDEFYSGKAERDRVKQKAGDLYRFLKNEKNKNERKLKKHKQTLKKAKKAEHYQKLGELLTAHMHLVKSGDKTVTVTDYYDPDQHSLTIELNPNKSPSENAQGFFKTYQKLKTSKQVVKKEMKKANTEIAYMEQLLQQINVASESDIEEIREELREEGYLKKQTQGGKKKKNKQKKPMPEEFISSDGTTIFVGKNNKQNEYVTTRLAHRDDIWLHALNIPGSHVVIRESNPNENTLLEAAQLAAYFSKSQASSSVPVDYTKIRHVKKPKGAKPGFVTYDNQKTLFVTPEKSKVDKLKKQG